MVGGERKRILAADTSRGNLRVLQEVLEREGYEVVCASDLDQLQEAISSPEMISLALIDLAGFDERIWMACQTLREKAVPFFLISPRQGRAIQAAGIRQGARGVLTKPLAVRELIGLIRGLL